MPDETDYEAIKQAARMLLRAGIVLSGIDYFQMWGDGPYYRISTPDEVVENIQALARYENGKDE